MSSLSVKRELNIKAKTQIQRYVNFYNIKGKSPFDQKTRSRDTSSKKARHKTKFNSTYRDQKNNIIKQHILDLHKKYRVTYDRKRIRI